MKQSNKETSCNLATTGTNHRKKLKKAALKILERQGIRKYCVLSLRNNKEIRSPWFKSFENTQLALNIIKAKGFRAIIYID